VSGDRVRRGDRANGRRTASAGSCVTGGQSTELTVAEEPSKNDAVPAPEESSAAETMAQPETPPVPDRGSSGDTVPSRRRRRRPLRIAVTLLASLGVLAAGTVAATGAFGGTDTEASAPDEASGPPKSATVEKTSLTRTETLDGILGYGEAAPVQAAGQGVVTWLPDAGDTVRRGEAAYRVDEEEVPLLYGATPLYRTLGIGVEGRDVEVLEKNLADLGYDGFTVDDTYTQGTADAVRDWQEDLGREETGTVRTGDAVVAPGCPGGGRTGCPCQRCGPDLDRYGTYGHRRPRRAGPGPGVRGRDTVWTIAYFPRGKFT
jgi:hypothetical protein